MCSDHILYIYMDEYIFVYAYELKLHTISINAPLIKRLTSWVASSRLKIQRLVVVFLRCIYLFIIINQKLSPSGDVLLRCELDLVDLPMRPSMSSIHPPIHPAIIIVYNLLHTTTYTNRFQHDTLYYINCEMNVCQSFAHQPPQNMRTTRIDKFAAAQGKRKSN